MVNVSSKTGLMVKGMYLLHLFYLVCIPGIANGLFLMKMIEGGEAQGGKMAGIFFLGAFLMAFYLGITAEIRSFPKTFWKAVYELFSIPVLILLFVFVQEGTLYDFFVTAFFAEMVGMFVACVRVFYDMNLRNEKIRKKTLEDGGGCAFSVLVFFLVVNVLALFFSSETEIDILGAVTLLAVVFVNVYNNVFLIGEGEREGSAFASRFILVGVFFWLASFVWPGLVLEFF